jgi:H+/Cl- antiporter ClcA
MSWLRNSMRIDIPPRLKRALTRRRWRTARSMAVARRRIATGVGAVLLGLVALGFADLGNWAQGRFEGLVARLPYLPLILTPLLFVLVAGLTKRIAPNARGSGIPQVIAASKLIDRPGQGPPLDLRTAVLKLGLTVAMLFGGASVGREGPTVQISAALMVWIHRLLRVPITAGVLIAGGAAGVAAAFNTPLAGIAFAIEELAAAYEQRLALLVMAAVMISGLVSLGIAGDYVYFGAMGQTLGLGSVLVIAPVAALIGGIAGALFSKAVLYGARSQRRPMAWARSHPLAFAALCGILVAGIGIASGGTTWGTGYAATRSLVEGHGQSLWFGPAKLLSTLATTLSGAPGGIFAPSLAVGAGVGNLISPLFAGTPAGPIVLLGMVAYFVGVVRAPLTGVIILSEITASRGMILPLFVTALIADAVSALICRERLYHGLSMSFLTAEADQAQPHGRIGQSPPRP